MAELGRKRLNCATECYAEMTDGELDRQTICWVLALMCV